jgi:enoyl-CoA hydratase
MGYTVFDVEQEQGVGTLWLDNAERRNAMGPPFWDELPRVMQEISRDDGIRAVVLAARGPHFSVGLDLKTMVGTLSGGELSELSAAARRKILMDEIGRLQGSINSVADCPKPIIAAIHGYCLGGGIDLITACDIRVASRDAVFSIRETRMAMVADVGTLQRLPGIVGKGIAAQLALTGEDVKAEYARQIGLVNSVFDDAQATVSSAQEMAERIARNSPLAVQGTKKVMRYSEGKSVEDGLDYVRTYNAAFIQSDDLQEAVTAFLEKREPSFKGQ